MDFSVYGDLYMVIYTNYDVQKKKQLMIIADYNLDLETAQECAEEVVKERESQGYTTDIWIVKHSHF